jgi:hypothetical protein
MEHRFIIARRRLSIFPVRLAKTPQLFVTSLGKEVSWFIFHPISGPNVPGCLAQLWSPHFSYPRKRLSHGLNWFKFLYIRHCIYPASYRTRLIFISLRFRAPKMIDVVQIQSSSQVPQVVTQDNDIPLASVANGYQSFMETNC